MAKPVGFLSRESRATLTSGLANIRHPSTTLLYKHMFKLNENNNNNNNNNNNSAIVFI